MIRTLLIYPKEDPKVSIELFGSEVTRICVVGNDGLPVGFVLPYEDADAMFRDAIKAGEASDQ